MARHSSALTSLCGCLRGMPPVDIDWTSVIGLANQTLTTPALIDFVDKYAAMLPEDVCTYIRHIHRRNVLRNNRLIAQLEEAVVAMNVHGITPILLKGASTLATSPEARRSVRIMSDLDIMVMPDEARTAIAALCGIGYDINDQTPPESQRWHADLIRSQDVGSIDLQQAAPGPAYLYQNFGHALKNTLVPVITITGLQLGSIIAFSIITETVFQWPGMGLLFLQAVQQVDIPIMAAYLLLIAFVFTLINFIVDILYVAVDPRIRIGGAKA